MPSINTEVRFVKDSGFSEEFIAVTECNNLYTISELLNLTRQELMDIPNFTFHMLREYREFLAENGLDTK